MDHDYFDIDAIWAESQKLSCQFKQTVPGLGYLDAGKERDVCAHLYVSRVADCVVDQEGDDITIAVLAAGAPCIRVRRACMHRWAVNSDHGGYSGHVSFDIPQPFSRRVQHALNAEPRAVKLSSLVGVGNHWYAHGINIVQLYVHSLPMCCTTLSCG
ncbi:hypothetical protein BKA62DRAFT_690679 [Auriculariales sp. MPI-PUGE-AT-0066]|nr:hypothetical protein BKA62DRAFT_690679 [Auriculariales sp. MPI-PUGE-AT-0066]